MDNTEIETVEEIKLLGLMVRNDLSWKANTDSMTLEDLTDIYIKQVHSILEFGVPVWNVGLTKDEVMNIERVQKSFLYIALGDGYLNYKSAIQATGLETLSSRRTILCRKFAVKTAKHPTHSHWFVESQPGPDTRSEKT